MAAADTRAASDAGPTGCCWRTWAGSPYRRPWRDRTTRSEPR